MPASKYVYGIIEEPKPRKFQFRGLEDAEVYTVNHDNLAAVVSDTTLKEVDPTRRNVLAHTLVQDALLKSYSVLPMGFGSVSSGADTVRRLLEANRESLAEELKRLSGKIQAEVKAFWDEAALAGQNRELLDRLRTRIKMATDETAAQRLAMEAGKTVQGIVMDWRTRYAGPVFNTLKELSVEARLGEPSGVKCILNASFLIEKSKEAEFVEKVRSLDREYQGRLNFKYVGPLSPYDFVKVHLEN